jgi:hypothetical protein
LPDSQRGVTREAPPYNMPGAAGAAGAAQSGAVGDGEPPLGDDEALARALQDEYDREHSDLRQQANRQQQQQPLSDYRSAGYADLHASTMPSMVPVDVVYYFYYCCYCCCYGNYGYADLHASTMPSMVPVDVVYYFYYCCYYFYYCCYCCCYGKESLRVPYYHSNYY